MIDNLVLIFVLVANLFYTNFHMFINKFMQLNNLFLQRKTKEEETEKWVDQNWKTLWRTQKEKNDGERNKENEDETEKGKDRQTEVEKRSKLTNKEKEEQRERNKEYKRKSRASKSYQKVLGIWLKDRNHKQKDKDTLKRKRKPSNSYKDYSTPRVQQHRERRKSQNSPFQVKLHFKLLLRNLSNTTHTKVREITDSINWLKSSSRKAVAIRAVVNSQSPNFSRAMQDAVINWQSDETPQLILSSLKNKKDKSNAIRRTFISGIAKSSTPLTQQRIKSGQLVLKEHAQLSDQLKIQIFY